MKFRLAVCLLTCLFTTAGFRRGVLAVEPIPDKLVVLTFDDSAKSHYTTARPVLKRYGFGATFLITEGFDFPTNKTDFMTWQEIAELHRDGFEIGNHTRDHLNITKANIAQLEEQLEAINEQCRRHGIPRTVSFSYPGNSIVPQAFPALAKAGIRFARRGGGPEHEYRQGRGFAYEPGFDHPLLIPSAGDARPDWTLDDFVAAVEQARHGRIAVLQFHGIPDTAHGWVSTSAQQFEAYMNYLAKNHYTVIAMRDLAKYVDAEAMPSDPQQIIDDRRESLAQNLSRENYRRLATDEELRYWLTNMFVDHAFTDWEASAATGLSVEEIAALNYRLAIRRRAAKPETDAAAVLKVRPYPGGRHPRIGFLDGAIRPQRETKFSVFLPWDIRQYLVLDVPEAIWMQHGDERQLLYLAHTHVPTIWSRQGIQLDPLEWNVADNGSLRVERRLPNGAVFGAAIFPHRDSVRMELWLTNRTQETLRGLAVQNCLMLKGATEFNVQSNDNKVFRDPYVACRNAAGDRWIITAWENCVKAWGNAPCPCMHSDPQFPDCAPGDTRRVRGWLSFFEGTHIEGELQRIERLNWCQPAE